MGIPALLQEIYDAYREKRLADVLSHFDDDFTYVLHLPEEILPGGDRPRNKVETEEVFRHFMDRYDVLSYDPGPIIVTGDKATAQPEVRIRHKLTGKILATKLRHLWQIRAGTVVGLDVNCDLPVIEAFEKSIAPNRT